MKTQTLLIFSLLSGSILFTSCSDNVATHAPVDADLKPQKTEELTKQKDKKLPDSARKKEISEASKPKASPKVKPGSITGVDVARVFTMRQNDQALLVDCRPPIFYKMGHINGSISLPKKKYDAVFPSVKAQLNAAKSSGKIIVLYCQNTECPDAYAVAKKLSPLGYSVSIYKGGWEEWKQAGFE